MTGNHQAEAFDCGDGVPNLHFTGEAPTAAAGQPVEVRLADIDQLGPNPDNAQPTTTGAGPGLQPGPVILVLTLLGQVILLLAVLAGGNPVVGAAAGLALLACGLTVIGVRAALEAFGRT